MFIIIIIIKSLSFSAGTDGPQTDSTDRLVKSEHLEGWELLTAMNICSRFCQDRFRGGSIMTPMARIFLHK